MHSGSLEQGKLAFRIQLWHIYIYVALLWRVLYAWMVQETSGSSWHVFGFVYAQIHGILNMMHNYGMFISMYIVHIKQQTHYLHFWLKISDAFNVITSEQIQCI